jgi:hypothetical protein
MREQDEAVAPAALADDTASTLDKAKKQSHEREEALRSKLLRQANKERTLVCSCAVLFALLLTSN